jgi:uncharacterized protein (TIGR03067 family)
MMKNGILAILVGCVTAIGSLASAAPAAEPGQNKHDVAAMQGVWAIESFTLEGNSISPDQLKTWRRIVNHNHVTWNIGNDTMIELDITFDSSKKPMTLDSKIATGESKGQVLLAIYELKSDELRVCFANPDQPRPTKFSSNPGSGQSMYVVKRIKP